ncbi:hypothetical protein KVR01_002979 [Diaporthe batatas]|uniref:uncharacterized protein n=1 Tax=Diaporthe batatas TaxID=748121 RepID=UPI001D047B21|nr:uncharacterized protein KVR01_002979 [Diaporthe batatas]KAG8167290.1 hypothetical protein KVR01_002979 [Diaporthe batatas]
MYSTAHREGSSLGVIDSSLVSRLPLLLLQVRYHLLQPSSAKMRFSQVLSTAIAAGVATAEPLANVLAANNNTLSTLNSILAGMPQFTQALTTISNITILAPSNDAFEKAMKAMPGLTNDMNMVTALLQYHVMSGVMMSTAFTETPKFVSTFMGMPFSMVTGNQKVELVKMENMAMIFSGFKQMSSVTKADIAFDGGVVHVIDKVLTIPMSPSVTATDMGLTSLAGALTKTNMVMAVDSLSDVTIFAPSNKAFENIGSAAESASVMDLSTILSYHVLHGGDMAMFSTNLLMGSSAMSGTTMAMPGMANMPMRRQSMNSTPMTFATLQGGNVNVRMENGKVFVNSAQVTIADIITSNGVIHVIDNVLNPMMADAMPNPTATTQTPAFSGATPVQDAPFTEGISPTTTITAGGMTGGAGVFAAMPTAAFLGAVGGAALLAGL